MRLKKSTEQQVLLNILKGELPTHLDNVNVSELFNLFQRHRLFPMATGIIELLDEGSKKQWKNTIKAHTLRSLHYTSVLSNIITGFRNEGIEAIPLKGPILAHSLYGNIGDRHFWDLDILIRGKDITQITEFAEGLGYSLSYPKSGLSLRQWTYYFKYKKDIGLLNQDQQAFVELHTGIYYSDLLNQANEDLFLEDLTDIEVGGISFRSMNVSNTFLYLVFHGGIHMYFRLFWLRDVAEGLRRWDLDHERIFSDARNLGIERLLGVSLELCSHYFNSEIPKEYHPFCNKESRILLKLKQLCIQRIQGQEHLSFTGRLKRQWYIFSLKPGFLYKWAIVKSIFHRWYIGKFLGGH